MRSTHRNGGPSVIDPPAPGFQPFRVLEIELSQPLPSLPARYPETGRRYECAFVLVRLHSQPIGQVELKIPENSLEAEALASELWRAPGDEINAQLRRDNLRNNALLKVAGLPERDKPFCLPQHERLLANPPFVGIVVAARDHTESLQITLRSLLEQTYPQAEYYRVADHAGGRSGLRP